jgi:hypothetical protein
MINFKKGAPFPKSALTQPFSKEKFEVTDSLFHCMNVGMRECESQEFLVGRGKSLRGKK